MGMNINATGGTSLAYALIPDDEAPVNNFPAVYKAVVAKDSDGVRNLLGSLSCFEKIEFFQFSGEYGLPLHIAAAGNDVDTMNALLAALTEFNDDQKMALLMLSTSSEGSSLCVAAQKKYSVIVDVLLDAAPADRQMELLQLRRADGATPLWLAVTVGDNSLTVSTLIKRIDGKQRADLLMLSGPDGRIPLHVALDNEGKQLANLIRVLPIERLGELVLMRDPVGRQMLHIVASGRFPENLVFQILDRRSNDIIVKWLNQFDRDQKTPLLLAVENEDLTFLTKVFEVVKARSEIFSEDRKKKIMSFEGQRLGEAINKSSHEVKKFFSALCKHDEEEMKSCFGGITIEGGSVESPSRLRPRSPRSPQSPLSTNGMNLPVSVKRPLSILSTSTAPPRGRVAASRVGEHDPTVIGLRQAKPPSAQNSREEQELVQLPPVQAAPGPNPMGD